MNKYVQSFFQTMLGYCWNQNDAHYIDLLLTGLVQIVGSNLILRTAQPILWR